MVSYRLVLPRCALAVTTICALVAGGSRFASAQVAFPAPLPGQSASTQTSASPQQPLSNQPSPFPPVGSAASTPMKPLNEPLAFPSNGVSPMGQGFSAAPPQASQGGGGGGANQNCMNEFLPLKQDAEKKGEYLQALGKRKHKTVQEACKGFTAYSQAEYKMMKFVEKNAQRCGIPPDVPKQMQDQHKNTEATQNKICAMAAQADQAPRQGPAMSLSEALGATSDLPQAREPSKRGGGTIFDTLNGNVLAR